MSVPAVISGEVVQPDYVSQPHSYAARDFFNALRDLVGRTVYHHEGEQSDALSAITAYEKHVIIPSDLARVTSEADTAPREDVSLRVAPSGVPAATAPGVPIDYARLAAAIVAAEAAQRARDAAPVDAVVTDAPPAPVPGPVAVYPGQTVTG